LEDLGCGLLVDQGCAIIGHHQERPLKENRYLIWKANEKRPMASWRI